MSEKIKNLNIDYLKKKVNESKSTKDLLFNLNIKFSNYNSKLIRKKIKNYKININHFSFNKNKTFNNNKYCNDPNCELKNILQPIENFRIRNKEKNIYRNECKKCCCKKNKNKIPI